MDHQTYIVSANEIVPGIWVGNEAASQSIKFLSDHNICAVVNCTKHIPFANYPGAKLRIAVNDPGSGHTIDQEDMTIMMRAIPDALTFINNNRNRKLGKYSPVLIHCHAGMQRSAVVATLYIAKYVIFPRINGNYISMASKKESVDRAIGLLIARRPVAFSYGTSINFQPVLDRYLTL